MIITEEKKSGYNITTRIFDSGFIRIQMEKEKRWIEVRKSECLRLSDIPTYEERKILGEKLKMLAGIKYTNSCK